MTKRRKHPGWIPDGEIAKSQTAISPAEWSKKASRDAGRAAAERDAARRQQQRSKK